MDQNENDRIKSIGLLNMCDSLLEGKCIIQLSPLQRARENPLSVVLLQASPYHPHAVK